MRLIETPERQNSPDLAEIMSRYILTNAWLADEVKKAKAPRDKRELNEQIKFNNYLLLVLAELKTGKLPGIEQRSA